MLSIERHSQTNKTRNTCSFLQLNAVTNHKIAWLLILAGVPVTNTGRSIHSKWSGCSFSLLRLIVCCRKRATFAEWVDEKTKAAKSWFRFSCAPYHVPKWPTQPSSNWLSAISEQKLQSEFMKKQLIVQRHRFRCVYHASKFVINK